MRPKIPLIQATDFPDNVALWCIEECIYVRYEDRVVYVENDGNPLWEWLVSEGEADPAKGSIVIAVVC